MLMEPRNPPDPAPPLDETSSEQTLPGETPVEGFTEEQIQYLQGMIAGVNAGLLALGKPGVNSSK